MNLAQSAGASALSAIGTLLNSGTAVAYQGAIPASPETAISGQTVLATWDYAASAMGTPSYNGSGLETAPLAFTVASVTPSANGNACFIRSIESGGGVVTDATVSAPWQASTAVILGQYVSNGGNLYVCTTGGTTASTGGPTGTGTGITDGTAVWNYVLAGTGDFTFGTTAFSTGTTVDITSLSMSVPVA